MISKRKVIDDIHSVLFLDIDGCLHPGGVYGTESGGVVSEFGDDFCLLQFQPLLEERLKAYPNLKIVLSTNWVPHIGLDKTKSYFTESICERIVGSTFQVGMDFNDWNGITRGQQIRNYIEMFPVSDWIVLDDRIDGFDNEIFIKKHVCPDEYIGLGNLKTLNDLDEALLLNIRSDLISFKNVESASPLLISPCRP